MATSKPTYLHSPRFSVDQRETLDAIGKALKCRRIDFFTAAELSDMVKAGQIDAVLEALTQLTDEPVKLTRSAGLLRRIQLIR